MSSNYNYFLKVVNEIRKDRGVDVEDLTDEVMSSRSYYRYLNDEKEIRIEMLGELVDRLNATLSDLVFYKLHAKEKTSVFNEFLIFYTRENYSECDKYYSQLQEYSDEKDDFMILIQSIMNEYDYKTGILSKLQYESTLHQFCNKLDFEANITMYKVYFESLYWINTDTLINKDSLQRIIDFYKDESQYKKRILLFFLFAPRVIEKLQTIDFDKNVIIDIINVMTKAVFSRPDMYTNNVLNKIQTQMQFKLGNTELFEDYLYKYIMGRTITRKSNEWISEEKELNRKYNIDISEFIKKESIERLKM